MNKKNEVLNEIISYVNQNKIMPTRRYLQTKLNFKSVNSITRYIEILKKENYLLKNNDGKTILNKDIFFYKRAFKTIKVINTKDLYLHVIINNNKDYIGYKIHNNYFNKRGIIRGDILIIELNKKLKTNDIGLFIIDGKYRIMKYNYKDGFYILKDNEEILLNKVKTIGKVIFIERKL